jgi:putative nucleotidyltransferase with HDIG domain
MNFNKNIQLNIENDSINRLLKDFCLEFTGIKLYLVGGYLRDIILNIPTIDRDYTVCGIKGVLFASKLSEKLKTKCIILDNKHDVARVILPDKQNYLDIAGCQGIDIHEDLSRRDFTVNAMAYLLVPEGSNEVIDPHNGQRDIKNSIIRAISEKNIVDDPLRILRSYRFALHLSGTIDETTRMAINKNSSLLKNIAAERIQAELNKIFAADNSFIYVHEMAYNGILETLIPEMTLLRKVPSNVYHHLGLYEHTLEVYRQIEVLFSGMPEKTREHFKSNATSSIQRIVALKYAALLHDIAKPDTWLIDNEGKHTFLGHADQGAEKAELIARRLKLPNIIIKIIKQLTKYHLYPSQLAPYFQKPSKKAKSRFFKKLGNDVPEVILLAKADRIAAQGEKITEKIVKARLEMLDELLNDYYKSLEKAVELPKIIDGNDVMKILNIKPSEKVGKILNEIRELQTEGELKTSEEAINWIKTNYE